MPVQPVQVAKNNIRQTAISGKPLIGRLRLLL
jgi:hypothetical protein